MEPSSWKRAGERDLIGTDPPIERLVRQWRNPLYEEGMWLKHYGFMLAGILLMVVLGFARWYLDTYQQWPHQALQQKISIGILVGLFTVIRIQLAATPALLITTKMRGSILNYFQTTLNWWNVSAPAMFLTALNRGALQYGFWSTIEILFYIYFVGPAFGMGLDILDYLLVCVVTGPFIFVVMTLIGMFLCGMGIVGSMVYRHPGIVYLAVVLPTLISLISAGPDFIRGFFGTFSSDVPPILGTHPVTLFLAPENRILSCFDFAALKITDLGSYGIFEILRLALLPGMFAFYLWAGIWVVLWLRLRPGDEKLDSSK